MAMQKTGIIKFPPYINEVSVYIGKLRNLFNYDTKNNQSAYDRGEMNDSVDILGVKGELIFIDFLYWSAYEFVTPPILAKDPISSYDVKIGDNVLIDIKAVRGNANRLLVNQRAHDKKTMITHYAFVMITEVDTACYWIYSYKEVGLWELVDASMKGNNPSMAYSLKLNDNG